MKLTVDVDIEFSEECDPFILEMMGNEATFRSWLTDKLYFQYCGPDTLKSVSVTIDNKTTMIA